jgi:hypothetical protein
MVKDVIHPLPPMAKLDWQRVADAWNFAAEAAEKTPADLAMGAGAVEAIKRHPALFARAIERPAFFGSMVACISCRLSPLSASRFTAGASGFLKSARVSNTAAIIPTRLRLCLSNYHLLGAKID